MLTLGRHDYVKISAYRPSLITKEYSKVQWLCQDSGIMDDYYSLFQNITNIKMPIKMRSKPTFIRRNLHLGTIVSSSY